MAKEPDTSLSEAKCTVYNFKPCKIQPIINLLFILEARGQPIVVYACACPTLDVYCTPVWQLLYRVLYSLLTPYDVSLSNFLCSSRGFLRLVLTLTMPLGNVPHQVHAIHILRETLAVVKIFAIAVLSRPATESLEYPSRPETVHQLGNVPPELHIWMIWRSGTTSTSSRSCPLSLAVRGLPSRIDN